MHSESAMGYYTLCVEAPQATAPFVVNPTATSKPFA
jgi:hypothetical protein